MWHGNCTNASCVHWQLSSKFPTAFDGAFQIDFISLALDFFRERWQRIPRSYFPFGALIINRTILLLLLFFSFWFNISQQLSGRHNMWYSWEVLPKTEWQGAPIPAAPLPSKQGQNIKITGLVGLTRDCLIHPAVPE